LKIITGIKPTGAPHVGNYLGMIRPALDLVAGGEVLYFVADYHALTTVRDPAALRRRTREVAATWLALGLDPSASALYRQSDLPELCELMWLLACSTAKGLLNRAHAYKAAVAANRARGVDDDAGVRAGLFDYPVLMAADILIHRADAVPVGGDQAQHLEIARDIADAFNASYGPVFNAPQALVDPAVKVVPGLDCRKMSKSYGNEIPLFAPPADVRRRVMSIVTDSRRPDEPKDPETDAIYGLFRHLAPPDDVRAVAERYRAGGRAGLGYGEAKQLLLDVLEATFGPGRARYHELLEAPGAVESVLADGAERARASARPTLEAARAAVGLPPAAVRRRPAPAVRAGPAV